MSEDTITYEGEWQPLSREDRLAISYGEETTRRTVPYCNEILKHMATLNVTLLGGSVVFLKEDVVSHGCRLMAVTAFLSALALALWGSMPTGGLVNIRFINRIWEHRERVLTIKLRCLRWACLSMFSGFLIILVGLAAR